MNQIFGRGLVPSAGDFGVGGRPPTHPELLDTLARGFMEDGWSVKRLVRRLVTSRTYALSSAPSAAGLEVDITEDAAVFTAENLAKYRAVAFMSTTGDVMGDVVAKDASKEAKAAAAEAALPRRAAFQAWLENGGAFVG